MISKILLEDLHLSKRILEARIEVLENEEEEETASKNFMCPRVYLVMLILNQVVSVSFLERERHRGVTCLVLSLELLMALGKL